MTGESRAAVIILGRRNSIKHQARWIQPVAPGYDRLSMLSPPLPRFRSRTAQVLFVSGLSAYVLMAVLARYHSYFDLDLRIARTIQSIELLGIAPLMIFVSAVGNGWIELSVVVAATAALIIAGLRTEGLICIAGIGLGKLVSSLLKLLSGRPRPGDALVQIGDGTYYNLSFPSGHAMFFTEFFGFLFFLTYVLVKPGLARTAGLLALGMLVVLVGVSRVYLGAHWPSDVIGGYLAGGLWLMLMIETYKAAVGPGKDRSGA